MSYNLFYFLFSTLIFLHLIAFQVKTLDVSEPQTCLRIFKSNNYLGFIVFINILIGGYF